MVAAYFYAQNDARLTQISLKPSDIDYQATQVKALQTSDKGAIGYQLTADKVTHYQNANTAILTNPRITLNSEAASDINLVAAQAQIDQTTQMATLTGGFVLTSTPQANNSQGISKLPIEIRGQDLVGDLVKKHVQSQQPLVFTQGNNRFESKSFVGNLIDGDYGFEQVSVVLQPAP